MLGQSMDERESVCCDLLHNGQWKKSAEGHTVAAHWHTAAALD